jgi:hypothetical protein
MDTSFEKLSNKEFINYMKVTQEAFEQEKARRIRECLQELEELGYNVNDTPVIEALPSEEPDCELEQQECNEAQVTNEVEVTDEEQVSDKEQVSDEVVVSETVMETPTPEIDAPTETDDKDDISAEGIDANGDGNGNEDEDDNVTPFFKIIPPKPTPKRMNNLCTPFFQYLQPKSKKIVKIGSTKSIEYPESRIISDWGILPCLTATHANTSIYVSKDNSAA